MKFGNLLGAIAHNGLAAVAGFALPAAANALQGLVAHSPYLAAHPAQNLVVGLVTGAIARDLLKTVPAFAQSSGTVATPR